MTDASPDLTRLVYSKTELGQKEIQSRALGLTPKIRSTLILVDGKRTGADLLALTGADNVASLAQLLEVGCIEGVEPRSAQPAPAAQGSAGAGVAALPPADSRDSKQVEMARNFMLNTVNNIFGQNMRLTLIESIHACKTAEELRRVYPSWEEAMASDRAGAKRLAEMREKLFAVL